MDRSTPAPAVPVPNRLAAYTPSQRDHDFGEHDSIIASAILHPDHAASRLADWFKGNVNTAAGVSDPESDPFGTARTSGEQQAASALNLAGLMQFGGSPFAPSSAGATLGTYIKPQALQWNHEAASMASKLLDEGADAANVWKDHLIGRTPDGRLFSEIDDSGLRPHTGFFLRNDPLIEPHEAMGSDQLCAILPHAELKANYPDVEKAQVTAYITPNVPLTSEFTPPTNYFAKPAGHIKINAANEDDLLGGLLYARQRALQQMDGGNQFPVDEYLAQSTQQRRDMGMEERRNNYPLANWLEP